MIPLFSYCCKKPICNVSMIFHIPDIHCLCDGWRRILISDRRILRSEHNCFRKNKFIISKSFMQHKVIEVDTQDSQTTSSVRDTQDPAPRCLRWECIYVLYPINIYLDTIYALSAPVQVRVYPIHIHINTEQHLGHLLPAAMGPCRTEGDAEYM